MKNGLCIGAAMLLIPTGAVAQIGPPAPIAVVPAAAPSADKPAPAAQSSEVDYRIYHGENGEAHQDCRRSNGTTGTIVGASAGGVIAGLAAAPTPLMAAWGAVAGGLLGRHLDRNHDAAQNARNGCPEA